MGTLSDAPKLSAHILVVSIPEPGHLIPSSSLAHQWAESGAQVTYLTTGYVFQHLQHRGSHTYASNSNPASASKIRFESLQEWPEVHDLTLPAVGKWLQPLSDEEMQVALERKFRHLDPAPCCIVSDLFLGWVQDVADRCGVPRLVFSCFSTNNLAFILRLPDLLKRGELPFTAAGATKKDILLPGMASILAEDVCEPLADGSDIGHQFLVNHLKRLNECSAIIVNTFEEFEAEALKALRTDFVAASIKVPQILPVLFFDIPSMERHGSQTSLPPSEEDSKSEVEKWLDTQAAASVIYVSFGSLTTVAEKDIASLALALEASNYPFLWVYRPPGKPHILNCTLNNSEINNLIPGFEERVRGRAMLYYGWAPQPQILTHPAIGAFFTHCGWSSVMESVCAGVPMLAWPLILDEMINARFITDIAHVGLRIHRNADGTVHQEEIEKVLKQMMVGEDGKAVRSNALKFKLLAAKNNAVGGTSATNLRKTVQQYGPSQSPTIRSTNSTTDVVN